MADFALLNDLIFSARGLDSVLRNIQLPRASRIGEIVLSAQGTNAGCGDIRIKLARWNPEFI